MDRLLGWLGASASRRAGIGGIAAGLLGLGALGRGQRAEAVGQRSGGQVRTVQITGTEMFIASPQQVWDFVTNPELGASCSAAVQQVTLISPDQFEVAVSRKYGRFNPSGTVEGIWSDMVAPSSGKLSGTGTASAGGSLEHSLEFTLAPALGGAATEVNYTAEVTFYGPLAKVNQAQLTSYVQSTAYLFVQCVHTTNGW